MKVDLAGGRFDAVLFDLDGVLTDTARLHAASWKRMFDAFLRRRAEATGEPFRPFEMEDYGLYVDGRPRYDGVRDFLKSRGIELPEGGPEDPTDRETGLPGWATARTRWSPRSSSPWESTHTRALWHW